MIEQTDQIDYAAVEQFVAPVAQYSVADIRTVMARLVRFALEGGERPKLSGQKVSAATVNEVRLALADELMRRGAGCMACAFGQWAKHQRCQHE